MPLSKMPPLISRYVKHFSSRRNLSCLATRIEEILGGFIATSRNQKWQFLVLQREMQFALRRELSCFWSGRDQNCRVWSRETRHFRCTVTICPPPTVPQQGHNFDSSENDFFHLFSIFWDKIRTFLGNSRSWTGLWRFHSHFTKKSRKIWKN